MRLKKIISLLLVLSVMATILTVTSGAAGAPTVTVGTAEACPGEKISIPVKLSDNPGIAAYTLAVNYDTTRLTLDSVKAAEGVGGMFEFGTKAVWAAEEDVSYNGTFLTLDFTVKSGAPLGNAAVTVSYNSGDICNFDEENVDFAVVPGNVKVTSPSIKVSDANVTAGDAFDVPVIISGNPGIAAVTLAVEYDEGILTLTGADSKVGGYIEVGEKLVWANDSDVTVSGEFFVLHFTAANDAAAGETSVSVSYNTGDICNFNEENVDFATVGGNVTVAGTQIVVGNVSGYMGGTFDVPVSIVKNPGVAAMTLGIVYDDTLLTFLGADSMVGGYIEVGEKLVWANDSDVTASGEFFVLHFAAKSGVKGVKTPVSVTYGDGDICNFNEENVEPAVSAGSIDISSVLIGDVDFDGKITVKDLNILKSMVVGKVTQTDARKAAGDINGDGKISVTDVNMLKQIIVK